MAALDSIAPFETAKEWDNPGLQVGDPLSDVTRITVALDATREAIEDAIRSGSDLIVTHHPLIMRPLRSLDLSRENVRKIAELLTNRISLVSMHTNLDVAQGGTADCLAERLGIKDVRAQGFLRVGNVAGSPSLKEWVAGLGFVSARVCDALRPVARVGVCPGSGMDLWEEALSLGCDTFVTGDVRYHGALDAREAGMNVVDLGHFPTEQLVLDGLAAMLRRSLVGMEVRVYRGRDVFAAIETTGEEKDH